MGWIRGSGRARIATRVSQPLVTTQEQSKHFAEHVEDISRPSKNEDCFAGRRSPMQEVKYPMQPLTVLDEDLPFIPSEVVQTKRRPGVLSIKGNHAEERKDYWLVIDNIVYDCTSFILDHPGGEQVILSFVGEDCTWQFWRFHGRNDMEQFGKELRIGRTKDILNRFQEPVRFVGLLKFGENEW